MSRPQRAKKPAWKVLEGLPEPHEWEPPVLKKQLGEELAQRVYVRVRGLPFEADRHFNVQKATAIPNGTNCPLSILIRFAKETEPVKKFTSRTSRCEIAVRDLSAFI